MWDGRPYAPRTSEAAGTEAATDQENRDTVLTGAMFCTYDRYVDGLGDADPRRPGGLRREGEVIVRDGYLAGLPKPE